MWPVLISVWATFLIYGAVAAPVPGVNEPHYLCKAKHFWQPNWCSPDFFLASPNAHTVFYATFGALTQFTSLENAAWIGRGFALLILAYGWARCSAQWFVTRWAGLWSAVLFLGLSSIGSFSGEWVVGGIEGKVCAYGFLLAAFAETLQGRSWRAATWAGLAVSFHPVVGVWGVMAYALSELGQRLFSSLRIPHQTWSQDTPLQVPVEESPQQTVAAENAVASTVGRFPGSRWWRVLPVVVLLLLSLPGLVPVIRLLSQSVSEETSYAANYLQVYFRLAHHLDPMVIPTRSYIGYALLLLVWLAGLCWEGKSRSKSHLDQLVAWALVFAVAGIVIGWGPRPPALMPYFAERMKLLKFYPFRLADVLLPMAVSVGLVSVLERTLLNSPFPKTWSGVIRSPLWLVVLLFVAALWRSHQFADLHRFARGDRRDWLDACLWIDQHLPHDALVQTPRNGWAFKWFAHRAEYVAYKDCPQDAPGLVEWNRRLNFLQKWYETHYSDGKYSNPELKELRRLTGITHILTDRLGPMEMSPIYRNQTFRVYDLVQLDQVTD